MSLNVLLISDVMIKERTAVHGNIDPSLIYGDIKLAQDMYIMPILGTALYDKLITDISGAGPTGVYKTLLDNYIVDALIYYTLAELPVTTSFQFWNKGVVRKQGEDTVLPDINELNSLASMYRNRAEFYANRLRLYLQQNAATSFPQYLNPGNGVDTVNPAHRAFTMPVYLGGADGCGQTFEEKYQGNQPNCCD